MVNLYKVYVDILFLVKDFMDNVNQIKKFDKMVEVIKKNEIDKIGIDVDEFIKLYGDYIFKV